MRTLLYALPFLFLCTCGPAPTPKETAVAALPWASATYLDPVPTELTFVNHGDTAIEFRASLRDAAYALDAELPDSLAPEQTITVTVAMTSPDAVVVHMGSEPSLRTLLPGYARRFEYDGALTTETGREASMYDYLDGLLMPINPAPLYPPEIGDVTQYHDELNRQFSAHLDSTGVDQNQPQWVADLVRREVDLLAFYRPLLVRNYRQFFFKDTLPLPVAYRDSVRRALRDPLAYHTSGFTQLYRALANYAGDTSTNREASISTRNNWAYAEGLLTDYPIPAYRHDATAAFLTNTIADRRMYGDKARIIDTLTASLPLAYQGQDCGVRYGDSDA